MSAYLHREHVSAFSGYRWSRDVIAMVVRWYLAYQLSSRQVLELLAERGIDVSHRTVLNWVQTFGPQLAAEVRRQRRRVGSSPMLHRKLNSNLALGGAECQDVRGFDH